jgi:ABC-2 type transport system permease protein
MNTSHPPHPAPPASTPTLHRDLPGWAATVSGLWGLSWRSAWSWRRWPVLLLLVVANPVLAWLALPVGRTEPFLHWVTNLYIGLMVPLWCLIAFGSLIRDELQAGTLGFLLTRPQTRIRLFLGRWLCTLGLVLVPLALNTLLLGVVGVLLEFPAASRFALSLLGIQLLLVPAYGAVASFLGLLTRRYLLLGLVYGFVVEIGIGQIPTNINTLSVARHFRTLFAQSDLVQQQLGWAPEGFWISIAALVMITAVYTCLSSILFSMHEYSQSEEQAH